MITQQQASSTLNHFLNQSKEAFGPKVTLSPIEGGESLLSCSDSSAPEDNQTSSVQVDYFVDNFKGSFAQSQQSFISFWRSKGWKLKFGKVVDHQAIVVSPDGYGLNYAPGPSETKASIGGSSPCFPTPTS